MQNIILGVRRLRKLKPGGTQKTLRVCRGYTDEKGSEPLSCRIPCITKLLMLKGHPPVSKAHCGYNFFHKYTSNIEIIISKRQIYILSNSFGFGRAKYQNQRAKRTDENSWCTGLKKV